MFKDITEGSSFEDINTIFHKFFDYPDDNNIRCDIDKIEGGKPYVKAGYKHLKEIVDQTNDENTRGIVIKLERFLGYSPENCCWRCYERIHVNDKKFRCLFCHNDIHLSKYQLYYIMSSFY
jgi:hypothetical protein